MEIISNISDISKEKANCMVCGKDVEYSNEATNAKCHYCGVEEETYILCKDDHYVCNKCHTRDAVEVIENVCLNTDQDDPMEIAEKLMAHPKIPMHGPEHHAMVPAVLIAAYQNYIGKKNKDAILEAIKRGQKIPGGYCALYGACGAGIGVGIAISILLGATGLTPEPRSHANRATAQTLKPIADAGGARCCKKSSRIGLEEGVKYISDLFDLNWYKELDLCVDCDYTKYNQQCDSNCKYRK